MKVEEIKKMKSGKYKVKIDNQVITTYDDVILNNHLLYQKEISEDDFEKIELDNTYADVYHKVLTYSLKKVRCVHEIKLYLEKFEIPVSEKEKIVDHLIKIGIVSDKAYVKAYISDSLYLTNDGPNKISNYLFAQEIDENLILDELDKIDQDYVQEKLNKLIDKKLQKDHKHSNYQLQQKIMLDMVNLGYDRDAIADILSKKDFKDDEKLEKEYDKIYHKLEKKYQEPELFYKIQEKLYSRGFDIHDIQNYIDTKKNQ